MGEIAFPRSSFTSTFRSARPEGQNSTRGLSPTPPPTESHDHVLTETGIEMEKDLLSHLSLPLTTLVHDLNAFWLELLDRLNILHWLICEGSYWTLLLNC